VRDLAATAVVNAVQDAGCELDAVDGIVTYHQNDSIGGMDLARAVGLRRLQWHQEILGGGSQCVATLGEAAMAIHAGLASTVVIYRALNGRSGKRMSRLSAREGAGAEQFAVPYGLQGPVHLFALACRLYQERTGAGAEDLAAVALLARKHAAANPRALMRDPLTMEDYLSARMVAEPLRVLDCCLETDGACALVVTRYDPAKNAAHRPVSIHTVVRGYGPAPGGLLDKAEDPSQLFTAYLADRLFSTAGLGRGDVDLAILYDAYTFTVLAQLEDLGFCPPGQAGGFLRSGGGTRSGPLPLNPHGGLLSEGYVHGLNSVAEAVLQLRGQAGERQVPDAEVALCTGFGGDIGSAAILTRG
jgi:acetyl-CoA acetyltransferase